MKTCNKCGLSKPLEAFRLRKDTGTHRNECKSCERKRYRQTKVDPVLSVETPRDPTNPREAKEIAMKRMLSSARQRAKEKGLMFNLHYDDVQIPNLCPVLKIPLIPSVDGTMTDNSPSLDRLVPYLGYIKGNVKVISVRANKIKSDATSRELEAVLQFVRKIEEENT